MFSCIYSDQQYHRRHEANYNAPEQGEVRNIVKVTFHPDYTGGAIETSYTSVDLALIQFDAPLSGPSVSIGSVQVGQTITAVGYGKPGTPSAGFLPVDGKRRAYQMPSIQTTRTNYYVSDSGTTVVIYPLKERRCRAILEAAS